MDVLEGIQVIDLSYGIAGPTVGMFLADSGAEVIKIESPAGDPARAEPGFAGTAAARLNGARVAAVPARRVTSVYRDPQLVLSEFVHVRPAADGSSFVTPGRFAAFSRTPRFGPLRSPGAGEHSREVLRTAGLPDAEIDALIASGAVKVGGPMPQALPPAYR